jgi:hypothetical protein
LQEFAVPSEFQSPGDRGALQLQAAGIPRLRPRAVPEGGADELAQEKLSPLLKLKYNNAIADAFADLRRPEEVGRVFVNFQQYLYPAGENNGLAPSQADGRRHRCEAEHWNLTAEPAGPLRRCAASPGANGS